MAVSEDIVLKVLELLPTHPSVEALMETDGLKDVRSAEIRAALRVLMERGHLVAGEMFGRD